MTPELKVQILERELLGLQSKARSLESELNVTWQKIRYINEQVSKLQEEFK